MLMGPIVLFLHTLYKTPGKQWSSQLQDADSK